MHSAGRYSRIAKQNPMDRHEYRIDEQSAIYPHLDANWFYLMGGIAKERSEVTSALAPRERPFETPGDIL